MEIGGLILTIVGSGGLWTLIQTLVTYKLNKDSNEKQALKSLLRDAIYKRCEKILREGTVTKEDLENIEGLYNPYIALGGNGTAKKMVDEVKSLHLDVTKGE